MATQSSLVAMALLVTLASSFVATMAASRVLLEPSWVPIKDVKDEKIVAIAEFGIKRYNELRPAHEPLKFVGVDHGEVLHRVGTNYHLYFTVSTSLGNEKYQMFVFIHTTGEWELVSFMKLPGQPEN